MTRRRRWIVSAIVVVALVALPRLVPDSYLRHLFTLGMVFAVLASSWDLTLGYAGIFNLAHVALFAVGAYASAIAIMVVGLPAWTGFLVAPAAAVLASLVAFIPAFRLRGVYVALTTFALSQMSQWLVLSQSDITGGTQGMVGIPPLELLGYSFARDGKIGYYYLAAAVLVVSIVLLRRVVQGRLGRSLLAIKDSEEYAQSRGINVPRQQLLAFALSAACAGVAGAFYASYLGVVSPDLFGFSYQALLMSMLWFGGVATIYGPVTGALVLTFVSDFLSPFGPIRFIVVSVLIIVTLLFFPRGIWGYVSDLVGRWAVRARSRAASGSSGSQA
jgi:ABC-type branched-subunit amino acid transport system permease subunit